MSEAEVRRGPTAVILTALPVEYEAVRAHFTDVETLVHSSGTRAECGRLAGTPWYVAIAEIGEGTLTAATLTERFHTWLHPQALLFVGVAGGLKDDIKAGDVVVATKVYGIHGGRQTPQGFLVRPRAWHPSHRLEQAARHALRGKAHFKPIAVGDIVLADAASAIARHLMEHYNDAVAIEMEGAGVAHAAQLTRTLDALIIRGISDNADAHKHELDAGGSQSNAAHNAADAAVALLRELAAPLPKSPELLPAYLRKADLTADRHPSPGLARLPVPALSAVYRPQRSIGLVSQTASPGLDARADQYGPATGRIADGAVLHPSTMLNVGNCLVLAGPGGGKSSLLRAVLLEGLRNSEAAAPVPVLLPARALANNHPLPLVIACHVEAELGRLSEQYPSTAAEPDPNTIALFASRPRPNAHWLLLVDALDEIIDPVQRRVVLDRLRALAEDDASAHHFLVTSRPLQCWELEHLSATVDRRELQPFDRAELRTFAVNWFKSRNVPLQDRDAEGLLALTEHSNYAAMVRVPLMATILCYLHQERLVKERTGPAPGNGHPTAVDVTQPPNSRGALYEWFTDLLHEQQVAAGLHERVRAALKDCDDRLVKNAIAQAGRRIAEMAVRQVSDAGPQAYQEEPCPQSVPPPVWEAVLRDIMLGTGLLTEQAGQLVFLHHTLAEYLAVRHLANDRQALARTVRSVLKTGRLQSLRLRLAHWQSYERPEGDSYTGFLLDRATPAVIDCAAQLRRIVALAGAGGSAFVVRQHLLGTRIEPDVVKDAVDMLTKEARNPKAMGWARIAAIELLIKCGDDRGADALAAVAARPLRLQIPRHRVPAELPFGAGAADYLQDQKQYRLLLTDLSRIVYDPDLPGTARVHAAITMEAVERKHVHGRSGLDALHAISISAPDPQDRKTARCALANARHSRGTPPSA
ncbi:hypothetical protein ACIRU2_15905 [Streptomyces sp. NPDC101169]|uniref:phosphorylase family protein n=1 Tax=Streptomyces sp. NPDC101169 TaxID=3366121 RepID=UPI003811967B